MIGKTSEIERFIDLVDQLDEEHTGTFDILGIGRDERDHTRMLAWLLQPSGSHGLGESVLISLLTEAGVSIPDKLDSATVTTFDQQPSDTELDIVVESGETISCIEIKTRDRLERDQYDRQVAYLKEVIEGVENRDGRPFEAWEYVYLAADTEHNPDFVQHRVTWHELLDSISTQLGAVDRDTDVIRLREWTDYLSSQLSRSESLTPSAELQLAYPELVEEYDIDLDHAAVKTSRQRMLSSYWQWLEEAYPAVANGNNGWETERSRIESRTSYIRLPKQKWPSGMRFEIQATEKRMTAGNNHSGDHDQYRTPQPHIELTLTYSDVDRQERDRLLAHLSADDRSVLEHGGFELIRDALPDDVPTEINKYHVHSKQVPIEFSNPEATVDGLRKGTECLMDLEEALDTFGTQPGPGKG